MPDRYFHALGPDQSWPSSYGPYEPNHPFAAVIAPTRRAARVEAVRHFRDQGVNFEDANPFGQIELFEMPRCPHGDAAFTVDESGGITSESHETCAPCEARDIATFHHGNALQFGWPKLAEVAP